MTNFKKTPIILTQKKEENINTNKWIEIIGITNTNYYTKDKIFKVLRIFPINYELKSDLEKAAILESFNSMLRTCNFQFEIICRSIKQNISKIIKIIEENDEKNIYDTYDTNLLASEYVKYLEKLIKTSKSSSKAFYVILYTNLEQNLTKSENKNKLNIEENDNFKNAEYKLEENIKIMKEMISRCGNTVKEMKGEELLEFLKMTVRQKEGDEFN